MNAHSGNVLDSQVVVILSHRQFVNLYRDSIEQVKTSKFNRMKTRLVLNLGYYHIPESY